MLKKIINSVYIVIMVGCVGIMGYYLALNRGWIQSKNPQMKDIPQTELQFLSDIDLKFEDIVQGTKLSFDYVIKNSGKEPLVVLDVITNCKCVGYTLSKRVALPNDSLKVTLLFDSKNKLDFQFAEAIIIANTKEKGYKVSFSGFVNSLP